MTKDDSAKVLAVKYVLDYNTFQKSDRLHRDLIEIRSQYILTNDKEFDALFEKYCEKLREDKYNMPLWARRIMAERYSLNI